MKVLLLLLLLLAIPASAQRQNNIWYFGDRAGLDFNSGTPVLLENGASNTLEGTASISDPKTGKLLFYTDGITVWNRNHQPMPNGTGLLGDLSSTQSAVVVPMPGRPLKYYIFTTDGADQNPPEFGLNYSIVDMALDGGKGDLELKNQILLRPSIEGHCAYRICGRDEFWMVAHGLGDDAFYAYRITSAGIAPPVISRVGEVHYNTVFGSIGALAFSHDGSMIASANHGSRNAGLFRFDITTGLLSRPLPLPLGLTLLLNYGLCFSPDNSKLYVSTIQGGVYQFDLSSGDSSTIVRSGVPLGGYTVGALQLGPDNRIYAAALTDLIVIPYPDRPGTACEYGSSIIDYRSARSNLSLPSLISSNMDLYQYRLASATPICSGDSVRLNASGGIGYRWSPATGLSCADCPSPFASPTETTRYTVEIASRYGCPVLDSVLVTVLPAPAVEAGAGKSICRGDSVRLSGSGAGTYSWSPASGLSCTTCPSPMAAPDVSTTYRLTVTGARGCTAVDSVRVVVFDPSTVDAGADTSLCAGESVVLTASEGSAWSWSPAEGLSCTDCRSPIASPDSSTLYKVVVTGDEGCSAADSVMVTILPLPVAEIASADTTICEGSSVRLTATGGSRYLWSPAEGLSCTDCADPIAAPARSTRYHLTLFNSSGCSSSDSITVGVEPLPVLVTSDDVMICRGESVNLSASGATRYRWSPSSGLGCSDCPEPVATPSTTTLYYVTGISESGCERLDSVLVTVADPPALTLSGDSTICGGSQAEVTASGAALYLWSAAGITLDCPTCATQKVSPAVTTILHVEGRSIEGCITVDSFRVAVVEAAEISVSGEGPICSGGSRQLHATGATSYRWEPADGLSCSDCADPVAGPGTTTTYRVIGSFPGGCADTVSVKVTVGDESRVIASLPRDLHLSIGASGRLTLRLDREITADTLELELAWRRGVIGLDRVALVDAVKADGWSIEVIGESEQSYHARLIRSTPALLREGDILSLEVRGYLGDSAATELPFTLTANSACTVIEPRPGRVTIDSICGLNIRLITAAKGMLRLDAPSPHPIIGQGVIRYAIPFDAGDVELRMIDPGGHVRLLGGGYHAAGEYEITLDARDIAPGVYLVHLRVGDLVRQMEVVVLR